MKLESNTAPMNHTQTPLNGWRTRSPEPTTRPEPTLRPKAPALVLDPDRPRRALTDREKQILRLVCDGLTNTGIATSLNVSRETVKSELKRIFRKIEVNNRTQAAVLLTRQRML